MIWPFSKRQSIPPEVERIFQKLDRYLSSEDAQNERYPDFLREQILSNPAVDMIPNASGEFGRTATNPIPVNGPLGELFYLSSLRKHPGEKIAFHRLGSRQSVDIYETLSFENGHKDVFFLSMYFPRKSTLAPRGYFLQPRERAEVRFLRGVNHTLTGFPFGLYAAAAEVAGKAFGATFVDADLKIFDTPIAAMPAASTPSSPTAERVRFQWSTMTDIENRGDLFVWFETRSNGSTAVACEQLPDFSASYPSIEIARRQIAFDLSGYINEIAGGTISIWTPDEYGEQRSKKQKDGPAE